MSKREGVAETAASGGPAAGLGQESKVTERDPIPPEAGGDDGAERSPCPPETVAEADLGPESAPGSSPAGEPVGADGDDLAVVETEADRDTLVARGVELEAELGAQREQTLRVQAELENLRRRAARDIQNAHKFGVERLVTELFPVKDSLELGLQAAEQEGADVQSLKEGAELTLKMLATVLGKFDVEEVDPHEARFDPELHQAMSIQEVAGVEPGRVVTVVQKGYTLAGRLVRPAMVIVSK